MRWSGTNITRSLATEGSGCTGRELSSTRQVLAMFPIKNIAVIIRARQIAKGTLRHSFVALRRWPTPLRYDRNSITDVIFRNTISKIQILRAVNWICCNQTDSTWQTPASGEHWEKYMILVGKLRNLCEDVRSLLLVSLSVAAV